MTTYYLDWDAGLDTNSGTSEGSPWQTGSKAMNTVAAGDTVYLKNTVPYLSQSDDWRVLTAGSQVNPIKFIGYGTTPGDGGMAVIDGENTAGYGIWCALAGASRYYYFANIRATRHISAGWGMGTMRTCVYENCEAINNDSEGFMLATGSILISCKANLNLGYGISGGSGYIYNCELNNNTGSGVSSATLMILNNVASGCGSADANIGVTGNSATSPAFIINCTVDGQSKIDDAGVLTGSTQPLLICNLLDTSCKKMVTQAVARSPMTIQSINNLYYDYNTLFTNWAADTTDVYGDPKLTGTFTLNATSAAMGAGQGLGAWNIGAAQQPYNPVGGGGGGLLQHPGMTGGVRG